MSMFRPSAPFENVIAWSRKRWGLGAELAVMKGSASRQVAAPVGRAVAMLSYGFSLAPEDWGSSLNWNFEHFRGKSVTPNLTTRDSLDTPCGAELSSCDGYLPALTLRSDGNRVVRRLF